MNKKPNLLPHFLLFILLAEIVFVFSGDTSQVLAQPQANQSIQLPRTGQETCYDVSGTPMSCLNTHQDGDLKKGAVWPTPRFAATTDLCLTDRLTGLMWDKNGNRPNIGKTWQEALNYVAGINSSASGLCGFHDWRLPNLNELQTLVNSEIGNNDAWLAAQGFSNVSMYGYWSSTTDTRLDFRYYAWYLDMRQRYLQTRRKDSYALTWPVRTDTSIIPISQPARTGQKKCYNMFPGTEIACAGTGQDGDLQAGAAGPHLRFGAGSSATAACVQDNLTSLMWAKNANLYGSMSTWQQALDYIEGLNSGTGLCGFHDWRLPNRVELSSLLDYSHWNKTILTPNPFTNIIPGEYWSSTSASYQYGPDAAWDVRLDTGDVFTSVKKLANAYLWPVRSSPANPEYDTFLPLLKH
jgi:hypothetical protein